MWRLRIHASTPGGYLIRDVEVPEIPETLTLEDHPGEIWELRASVPTGDRLRVYYARPGETIRVKRPAKGNGLQAEIHLGPGEAWHLLPDGREIHGRRG